MKKISIAICDTGQTYGERLGEWISLEKKDRLTGYCFSSPECFLEYQKQHEPDIVLLGNGFCENPDIRKQVRLPDETACGNNLMEEGSNIESKALWLYLHDPMGKEDVSEIIRRLPTVEKYQPASKIIRDIFSYYQNYQKAERETATTSCEMIGVYSPEHSIWQTPFTLTLAQTLGKKERVLYVNFKECAGFREWFHEDYRRDLLDVIYLCLTNEVNVADCIDSAVYTMEGFDYIPPAEDGVCLSEISGNDYKKFVRLLGKKSGYDVILLDFGMMSPGFFDLLGVCGNVYILTEAGELHEGPRQQFCRIAKRQSRPEMTEKFSYLALPHLSAGICQGETWMNQWVWGELGDYVRRLVGVQSGTD